MDNVKFKQFLKEKGAVEKDIIIAKVTAGELTEKEIDELVETYDPELHEAPNIIGHHPKDNEPAYGWVKKLFKKGKDLYERVTVLPELIEMVNKAMFKKRSIGWYEKDNPNNPTPGKIYLAHVAWLGAVPPAIKGMPDVTFSGNFDDLKIVEFSEEKEKIIKKEKLMELTQEQLDALIKLRIDEAQVEFKKEHDTEINTLSEKTKDSEIEIETLNETVKTKEKEITGKDKELQVFADQNAELEVGKVLDSDLKLKIIPANREMVTKQLLKFKKLSEEDFNDQVKIYKAQPDVIELGELKAAAGEGNEDGKTNIEKKAEEGTISIVDMIENEDKKGGK